ncbi:MAG: dihydrofolate reductase [Candidatus Eremiobacteraeota bacterium]|nr:dihydrofolate reductase [Candidatus Eremiobacteraeota bacterium]
MSKLIYITNTSLDGYIEDEAGGVKWENSEQIFPLFIELLRPIGTYLYGRRLYEKMAYWDAPLESYLPEQREFAQVWQQPEKIVFSRTLTHATTRNTRVERDFKADAVRKIKRESQRDITIGGAELAGLALEANLVDECHVLVHPVILGGGKRAFHAGLRRNLELLESRCVGTGVMHLHYRIRGVRSAVLAARV